MNLLFFGIQGSGKGTQAKIIAKNHSLLHISTGDLLREAKGELRKEIDSFILKGNLVPDELILKILKERISKPDASNGIILDGFPRNIQQANDLKKANINIDKVVLINISDNEAIRRMKGRWNCKKCGIPYNIVTEPKPKTSGICDVCKEKLTQRQDDVSQEAIAKRLETFHNETRPVLDFYKKQLITINGEQTIEKVTEEIEKALI